MAEAAQDESIDNQSIEHLTAEEIMQQAQRSSPPPQVIFDDSVIHPLLRNNCQPSIEIILAQRTKQKN